MTAPGNRAPVLETRGLYKKFGALEVTRNINITLEAGARHALIGPNGAGKTTLVNLITGQIRPTRGQVLMFGNDVSHLSQNRRVKQGIARTFQINTLFLGLTVIENIYLAASERLGVAGKQLRPAGSNPEVVDEATRIVEILKLEDEALTPVRELPYGRQRLVEFAIALALDPKVLLLDEPAAGVPSADSHILLDVIAALPGDIAVLIIEHDMDVVFRFAHEITVLVRGAVLAAGPSEEIARNPNVRAAYLGEAVDG